MKEYVVVSGKGGTGKTSLVAAFARLAGRRIALADCDVDASNLALLMPGRDISEEPFYGGLRVQIDGDKCSLCGNCVDVCRYNALFLAHDLVPQIDGVACEGCRACSVVCPEDALSYVSKKSGNLYVRESEVGPLVHASLGVAEDNSGKLVTKVRERARLLAKEQQLDTILLDGPPGIGCPVHATLSGARLVIAVTEPTPSGVHDLERLFKLCTHFDLRTALIVNKCDLNDVSLPELKHLAKDHGSEFVGGVPFHQGVPMALAQGKTPLDVPPVREALAQIWTRIERFEQTLEKGKKS